MTRNILTLRDASSIKIPSPMRAKAAQNLLKQLVHYPFETSIQSASDIQFSMTSYYLPLNKVFNAYEHTKSVNVDNVTSQPTHHI